jgi:hypothetical protein
VNHTVGVPIWSLIGTGATRLSIAGRGILCLSTRKISSVAHNSAGFSHALIGGDQHLPTEVATKLPARGDGNAFEAPHV